MHSKEPDVKTVKIGKVAFGGNVTLCIIAGPCVIESEKKTMNAAERLAKACSVAGVPFVFKTSYDKANRTSIKSYRGPGIKKGLKILKKVKDVLGLPVLSDVHSTQEVKEASEVLDCIQIPAFLCRQTDLIVAVAKTKRAVNIKKGQFLAPWNMKEIVEKVEQSGNKNILLTERGTSFGYNNLVVDFRSLSIMRNLGYPVIFDATHSVQLPGAGNSCSSGEKQYVKALSRAAAAFGCDGIFLETHDDPDKAPCDGANMISFDDFENLMVQLRSIADLTL